ncbi:MAG: hypothetical protein ACFFCH_06025 [Promethearchaeota archaeon]
MSDKDPKSTDVEEVRDILEAVQETVPALISQLVQAIYSPEVAEGIAEAIGSLYQGLKKKGLPDELVLEMTRKYMNVLDIKELMTEGISTERKSQDLDIRIERALQNKRAKKESS